MSYLFVKDTMKSEIQRLEALKGKCSEALRHLPRGCLQETMHNGRSYYHIVKSSERRYVGRESKEVTQIKVRYYYSHYVKVLAHNLDILKKAEKSLKDTDPFKLARRMPKAYSELPEKCFNDLGFQTPDQLRKRQGKQFMDSEKRHRAANGLMVRSKSEATIVGVYDSLPLNVVYEKPLMFPNGEVMYPDFTIMLEDGREIYHEHVGMITDPEYMKRFYHKMVTYIKNGYIPFRDVFFTFDDADGNIDDEAITKIIMHFLKQS